MNTPPKAYGIFQKKGQHIFRTEAKICWGEVKKPLGMIIMLNPGSSRLSDLELWNNFNSISNSSATISGEIKLDDTLKSVVKILEATHPDLQGTLIINNLFNLRDSKSETALKEYKKCFETGNRKKMMSDLRICVKEEYREVLHKELDSEEFSQFSWIWIAWTVNDGKFLNARRREILDKIPESLQKFVIYSHQKKHQARKELYAYHVSPQNPQHKAIYEKEMINQMLSYWHS